MSLEHGNNFENQSPVIKTGISEPKEFKKPSDNLNAINQREKIDNLLEKSKILPAEKEKIIDYILNKYDNSKYESIINQIIDGECETLDDVNSILTLNSNVQEVKINNQEKVSNVQEVQSNVEAEKDDLQVYSKIEPLLSGLTGKDSINLLKLLKDKDFEGVKKALKNPDTFESVVGELEQKDPEKYKQFKETLISIDPSFRESFDKYDYRVKETSKILNLGTPKISLDGKSGETTDGKHNIKIDDKGDRYLSSKDSPYQLKSNLDNKQNIEANQKIDTDLENNLKPINEKLNTLSSILDYLENAILKNIDLKDIKETIKKTNIGLYTELNIENLNSPSDIKNIIIQSIKKLEDDKKTAIEKAKNLKKELILKNTKEASEKDEAVKQLLKFLESIGFTSINQAKLQTILDFININPQTYGLDEKIDLENGVLGFNRDFGDKNINASEKQAFIKLFNRMLGEKIIDENIAFDKTTLSPQAIMKIQVLSNKTTGFFMKNLGKMGETK